MKSYILLTGAYGGMGRATAKALSEIGFCVFALDKLTEESDDERIIPIEADITDESSIKNALSVVSETTDSLFAIIHFAGIYMLDSLVEIEKDAFERIFKVNLEGVFLINKTLSLS